MIIRITGQLIDINSERAIIERDGICYEIHIPAFLQESLQLNLNKSVTFYTLEYFEGSGPGGNLFPRLIGFIDPTDRDFFTEFVKVKGLGYRKALRAFAKPAQDIANAIEQANVKWLTKLPEIGKRSAEQIIASLKGKLNQFVWKSTEKVNRQDELTQIQREALEILIQLGEKRNEAIQMIMEICDKDKSIKDAGLIVEAVYKQKAGRI